MPALLRENVQFSFIDVLNKPAYRPVQMTSLDCHALGAALPHVDTTDPETTIIGQNRRVCFNNPQADPELLNKLSMFVRSWCESNLVALPSSSDTSITSWLEKTNYPRWRKDELLSAWKLIDGVVEKRHFVVNGFVKDETYPEYKNSRGINARTDVFKCAVGPIFKLIEKEVFKNPWFIKYVPVPLRAKTIYDRLNVYDRLFATDHTSYEGHFDKHIMQAIEFQLYDYMTKNLCGAEEFMSYVNNVLGGENHVIFKHFSYKIRATRMTGEMCTSLGNGFTNLMLILFIAQESGLAEPEGFVEGDDSAFGIKGDKEFRTDLFKKLGFTIKLEELTDIETASFCGNVFAIGDFYNVTNPVEALLSFGWTSARYAKSKNSKLKRLLRSKALSLLYEYRGCPILKNLALYGLRVTEGYRALLPESNEYLREQLQLQLSDMKDNGIPIVEIPISTRYLVERLYNIPVEIQLRYENYLDGLTELQPLKTDLLSNNLHAEQVDYYLRYVVSVNPQEGLNYPNLMENFGIIWSEDFIRKINSERITVFDS